MIRSKAGKIAPYQLFFILFVSRVVVTLTYIQTVTVGKLTTDLLISLLIAYGLTMLFCVPIYLCAKNNKNPFDVKWISLLYSLYFVYFSALNVSRFSYFATSQLNPQLSIAFFALIIVVCACYAGIMGIEGISRFGVFCGVVLIITVVTVVCFNIKNSEFVNIFPIIDNTRSDVLKNSIVLTSNSIEPAVYLALVNKVNGKEKKTLFFGISASYFVIFILLLLCNLVMGSAAGLQAYPIFTVFQLASIGSMSRFDIFHTAFWVLALFFKVSILIYSASICIKKYRHSTKCVIISVITIAVAVVITVILGTKMVDITKIISVATFGVFCFLIPVLSLLLIKKRRMDDVIEKQ